MTKKYRRGVYACMLSINDNLVRAYTERAAQWFASLNSHYRLKVLRNLADMPTSQVGLLGRTRYYLVLLLYPYIAA